MQEGTKGVLRFMDEYKGLAGVQQECCFGIITWLSGLKALLFKRRLVKEGVIARVVTALARFSSHFGVQKQGLGVLHYIILIRTVIAFVCYSTQKLSLFASKRWKNPLLSCSVWNKKIELKVQALLAGNH